MAGEGGLSKSAWDDINEAVGDALGVTPPDAAQDRAPEGAPAHGSSPAKMVPAPQGEITAQEKLPDNGVRFQSISQEMAEALDEPPPIPPVYPTGPSKPLPPVPGMPYATAVEARQVFIEEERKKAEAQLARENAQRLRQSMPVFHDDGSLMGEYAPMQGDAITPDTVDGLWWLGLPEKRAIWELGIDPKDYPRVHRDISIAAAVVINRRAQTGQYIPLIIKRKKRRLNASLFQGGRWQNIRRINPSDFRGMNKPPE